MVNDVVVVCCSAEFTVSFIHFSFLMPKCDGRGLMKNEGTVCGPWSVTKSHYLEYLT